MPTGGIPMVHASRVDYRHKCIPMLALLLSLAPMESTAQVADDSSVDATTQQTNASTPDVDPCTTSTSPPCLGPQAPAAPALPANRLEVYGYVMTDFGYNFQTINPDWFDTMRPTKLPSFRDEFGRDGVTFAGVRQTRFGVKGFQPTKYGELQTTFEFELFGVGVD